MSKTVERAQSVTSGEPNDGQVEAELQKLQRQYRMMESERKAYSEESRQQIKKQKSAIDKLKRDNDYLVDELKLLERRIEDRKRTGASSKRAETLQQQAGTTAEFYQNKMKATAQVITQLDSQIAELNQRIGEQRARMGGVNAAITSDQSIQKQIHILENRLDKALTKYNKALAINKKLRDTINNFRRERLVFDNVYKKFEKELNELKKTMAEIIESSNSAYEARDEAQSKIVSLKEKAEKEYQAYIQEIKELDRTLEQDRKLKNFLATKASDRSADAATSGDAPAAGKLGNKSSYVAKSSQDILSETVSAYENAFNTIRELAGVQSLDELVQRFKDVEDQNFSLFNYVNEVNNEIEKISEEITSVQRQMSTLEVENAKAEAERKKQVRSLEIKLEESKGRTSEFDTKANEITATLETLQGGLLHLIDAFRNSTPTVINTALIPPTVQTPTPTDPTSPTATDSAGNPLAPSAAASSSSSDVSAGKMGGSSQLLSDSTHSVGKDELAASNGSGAATTEGEAGAAPGANAGSTDASVAVQGTNPLFIPPITIPAGSTSGDVLLTYLGVVEQKCNDLLVLHYLTSHPRKLASANPNGPGSPTPGSAGAGEDREGGANQNANNAARVGMSQVKVLAPSTGDNDSDEDDYDDDRPLSREELRNKSIKGLTKRMQNGGSQKKRRGGRRMMD
ncbi:hypothetical protein RI367_006753 [Sorochytrium milnesiophthora]